MIHLYGLGFFLQRNKETKNANKRSQSEKVVIPMSSQGSKKKS